MNKENFTAEKIISTINIEQRFLYSEFLERDVVIDFYLPADAVYKNDCNLLLINDGQDLQTMNFGELLDSLVLKKVIRPLLCAGIYCGANRMLEYGTIYSSDYKGRGSKAGLYSEFILCELLPFIQTEFNIISFKEKSFAGFSLGGLSALDIVWNYPYEFLRAGVFSGSLWWRRHGYDDKNYNAEKDRIMHLQVQKGALRPWLQFFFECGRYDETADRNNNGIIDSIEDTTDLIAELKKIGYTNNQIAYLELKDGKHDIETWKTSFPAFLLWGWGK